MPSEYDDDCDSVCVSPRIDRDRDAIDNEIKNVEDILKLLERRLELTAEQLRELRTEENNVETELEKLRASRASRATAIAARWFELKKLRETRSLAERAARSLAETEALLSSLSSDEDDDDDDGAAERKALRRHAAAAEAAAEAARAAEAAAEAAADREEGTVVTKLSNLPKAVEEAELKVTNLLDAKILLSKKLDALKAELALVPGCYVTSGGGRESIRLKKKPKTKKERKPKKKTRKPKNKTHTTKPKKKPKRKTTANKRRKRTRTRRR